ncbi:MAG: hypothetical protein R6V67_00195 [Spirochaetia bacterium]
MVRISGNSSLYLFFFSLIVLFLYVVGNLQGFLEETMLLLLIILEWVLFVFCITVLYYGIFTLVRAVKVKKHFASPLIAFLGFVYGAAMLAGLNLIYSWFFW